MWWFSNFFLIFLWQDHLPHEIIKLILSFLDDKNARIARLASTDWFRWINYSTFVFNFASSTLLPQIVARLSKYQYPIELTLQNLVNITDRDVLEHIPRLTQLKVFALSDHSTSQQRSLEPEEYLKLSTLTNLESLYLGYRRVVPSKLLQHLPRMKRCYNSFDTEDSDDFVQFVATHCPHYEAFDTTETALPLLPVSVTELNILTTGQSLKELSRLTRLKQLALRIDEDRSVDLRHITWLENLTCDTGKLTGLEFSHHLTELFVQTNMETDVSVLLDSLAAHSKMERLVLYLPNCGNVSLSSLSQLNTLYITSEGADVASFPTTLQELSLNLREGVPFELSAVSHLVHLTQLDADLCKTTAIEPLNSLTNLLELRLKMPRHERISSLSNLHNLTSLYLTDGEIEPQAITCLTNLQSLDFSNSQLEQETWENIQYLTKLTSLVFNSVVRPSYQTTFDCTVLAKLPLILLQTVMPGIKNYWAVLPTLTALESLTIGTGLVETEDDLLLLTALSNLTALRVHHQDNSAACVHLTALTTLRDVALYFPHNFTLGELSLKLTRLVNASI